MDLLNIPNNPAPADTVAGFIRAPDGTRIRYARWRHLATQRLGTVCLLQGRAEAIEKYFEVINDLRRRGYWVATFDWRGQGGSDRILRGRRKGYVKTFADYDLDLETFMQQVVLPDCPPPYFVLGHSTGGLIALRAAREHGSRFERMVLCAPLLGLARGNWPAPLVRFAGMMSTSLGLSGMRLPGQELWAADKMPFPGNVVTSDPARYGRYAEVLRADPGLAVGAATFGWLRAMHRALSDAADPDFGPSIHVPVLFIVAGQDSVVSTAAAARAAEELRAGAYIVIPGARHEILMERDGLRELFWAAFDAFIPGSAVGASSAV